MSSSDNSFMPRSFSTRNTMFLSAPNSAVQKQRDLEELDKTKKINEGNFQVTKFISSYLDKLDLVQKTQIKYPSLSNNTTNFFFNMGKQHSTKEHFNGGEIINKFFSSKKKSNINIDNTINLFKSKSKSKFIINNNNNNNSNSNNKVNSFFKSKQHSILQHKKEDNINNNKEDGSENDIKNFILTRHFSSVVDREKKKKQPTVTFGTCFGTGLGSIRNINNINYQDSSDALLGGIESTLIQNSNNNNNSNSNTKAPFNPSEFLLTKTYSSKKRGNDAFILNKRDKRNGTGGFILNHISCKNNASNNFILNHKTSSFNNNNNSNNNNSNNNSGFILNHKSNINNKNTETPSLFLKNKNNSRSNGDFILNHRASYGSSFLNNGNSFILNHNNNTNEKSFTLKYNNNNNNNNLQYINKKTLPNDNNNNNNNDNNSSNVNSFILSNISSNSKTTNNFTLNFRNKCSLSIFNQPHNQQVPSGLELLQRVSSNKSKLSNTQLDTILKKGKDTTINDNNNNNESTYIDNAIRKSSKMIFDLSKKNKTRSNKELYNGISLFNKNIKSLHNIKSNKTIESHNNNSKYNDELLNRFKSSHSRTAKRLSLFQYDSNDVEPKSERHKERRKLSIIFNDNVNNNKDENDIRNILDLNKNEYKEFNQLCSQLHQNISLRPTSTQNDDNEDDEDTTTHHHHNHHQTFNNIINDDKPKDIPQLTLETTTHKFNTNTNTNTNTNETLPTQTHKDIIDTPTHTHTHTHIDDIKILNELKHRYLPSHLSHVYDSLDDEENSDEVKETYYLEPFTSHRFIYDMFLFILEIYSLIFIPYDLAFTLHSPYTLGWKFILNLLIDCMFIIDIILGFFTAFYNNDDVLVIDIPLISINYIKTWFTIDLISGIPLNTLIDVFRYIYPQSPFTTVSSTSFHSNYIILINVLKCLRLVKGIKVFFHNTFSVKVSECVLNRFPSGKGFRLLITLLVFTICIHTFASFLVFIGNAFYPNWIVNYGLEPEHDIEVYIAGIYFVCVSIISVGYGDILCSNLVEKTLALILLTFGLGIYSWAISALSAFYEVDDLKTYEYKVKMDILNDIHSSYKNVTSVLIEKIQRHLLYRLNSDKIDCNAIIQDLPYSLRNAMLFEMYKPIINNFVFFKNFNSLDFIFKVIICLKPVYAVRNEKLINDGELVEETVFVKNGKLSLEFPLPLVFNNETLNSLTRQISFALSNDVVTYEQTSFIENLLRTGFTGRNVVVPSSTTTLNGVKSMLMDTQTVNANYLASSAVSSCKKNNFNLKEYTHNQQYVKLIEIRRNEHFGDVLMFLDKKSPLLAKVKTKKAELFLLKKTDAVDIAGEFPDIWKQIVRKSLFNMKQINRLINRSLKFFFIHYEGQNAHNKDKANMKRINTNDNAVGSNSMNTLLKRNANSRNTYIHQTHIDTCIGLLGEDEGDVELESVPDSDDIREEVEMEKMIEEGGIEDNGVGSVDETTKVGSEKRDGINIGGLVLVSKGNESNNGEEVNEGGSDYVNQMGNELQQKMCFLLLKKDNNNNNNNVEAVISNKAQSEKSKENENESDNNSNSSDKSNSKSNRSNRSNETIKHLNTKDNNNTNTNIVNSNTNTKPSVNLQTQAVISTKSSIKEIPKLLHKNNTIINKDLISSSNIDSTFRHKSTVKVSSHNSSYNDIDNYDLIDTESINSEYHSDEYELKKNILYSRTKRSNQPLLPPKNIKPFPKSLNHSKPEHDMLTESFLLKSKHSHNDKLINIKFSKDKFPSIHRKPSLTPTERSNKSGSVQSKDILNVSIGFHSINSSKSNIDLLKEGGSMNFNAPETENNISFIGSNIKLYTTNKINSTIAHSQIVNNSITKMRKRHSISPINKPLLINDMMVSSLKEGDIVSGNSLMFHKPKKKFTDVNIPHDHNNNNNNNSNSNHRKFSKRKSMVLFNKKIEHKTSTKSGACPASSQFEKLKMSPIKKRKDDGMIMFNSPKKKRLCDSCIINKIEPVLLDGQKRKTNTQRRKSMLLLHGDKGFRLAGSFGLSNNQNESKKMERRKSRLDVISSNIANDSLNLNNPEAFYSSMFAKVIDEDKKEKEMKIQKQSDNENENEC